MSATGASPARAGHVEQEPEGDGDGIQGGGRRLHGQLEGPSAGGEGVMEEMGAAVQAQAAGGAAGASALGLLCGQEGQPWGPCGPAPRGQLPPLPADSTDLAPGGTVEKGGVLGSSPGPHPASVGAGCQEGWRSPPTGSGYGRPALSPDQGPAGQGCDRWQRSCELRSPASQGLSKS